jgi:hypothetical protein
MSLVEPGSTGSGGAVMSCFSLYSGLACVASVLTVVSLPRLALGTESIGSCTAFIKSFPTSSMTTWLPVVGSVTVLPLGDIG